MASERGGRGAPFKDGIYRPSSSLKQAQFPPRRKSVRVHGKAGRRQETVALKQQTLTQIDFVSSFSEDPDPIVLSDSDKEGAGVGAGVGAENAKETEHTVEPDLDGRPNHRDDEVEDDSPPRPAKRRIRPNTEVRRKRLASTDGDNRTPKRKAGSVRQQSIPSSATPSHHTQTLTQFLRRDIAAPHLDAEDDQAFLDWLGEPCSPKRDDNDLCRKKESGLCQDTKGSTSDREGSVVPQTPVRSRKGHAEHISPAEVSTASTTQSQRHGRLDHQRFPQSIELAEEPTVKPTRHVDDPAPLVIRDSFATSSWNSETPTRRSQRYSALNESQDALIPALKTIQEAKPAAISPTPNYKADETLIQGVKDRPKVGFDVENLVQFVGQTKSGGAVSLNAKEIPDSEDDDVSDDWFQESQDDEAAYIAGAETELVLEELSFIAHQQQLEEEANANSEASTPLVPAPPSNAKPAPIHKTKSPTQDKHMQPSRVRNQANVKAKQKDRPPRRPLPPPVYDQSQFAESQRVPIQILQGLPPASARSDILLPIHPETLDSLIGGYQVELCISYKIPIQVVRFWLFDSSHLRYMACVQHGKPRGSEWAYAVDQMYELNNPVADQDMREEGWVDGQIRRYVYLPPAIVGQLLWNLKHALFDDDLIEQEHFAERKKSPSRLETGKIMHCPLSNGLPIAGCRASQQSTPTQTRDENDISAQGSETDDPTPSISNITPRPTASSHTQPPSSSPAKQPLATTDNSQNPSAQSASLPKPFPVLISSSQLYPDDQDHALSSSSIVFQDHGASAVSPLARDIHLNTSQLLTKSQMLPDSLLRDDARLPREIWDSDDDDFLV